MASLLKTLSDIKRLHQGGFSVSEAREFIAGVNDRKKGTAVLPAHLLYKDTRDIVLDILAAAPHIRNLTLEHWPMMRISEPHLDYFLANLNKTEVQSLTLDKVPPFMCSKINPAKLTRLSIKESFKPFASLNSISIENMPLESFSFTSCAFFKEDAAELETHLPKTLRHLTINCEDDRLETTDEYKSVVAGLPADMETLSLTGIKITTALAEALAEKLPLMPKLKTLELKAEKKNGITDKSLNILADAIARSNIRDLDFTGANVSDAAVNAFLDRIEPPPCLVSRLSFAEQAGKEPKKDKTRGLPSLQNIPPPPRRAGTGAAPKKAGAPVFYDLSSQTLKRIEQLQKTRKDLQPVLDKKPVKPAAVKKAADAGSAEYLFEAAKKGQIEEVYIALASQNRRLGTEDYLQKNAEGYKLIDVLGYTNQLDKVFAPGNWTNAKDMQTVFSNVADNQKYQLDGKEGRPSFTALKNRVMQESIKAAVMLKKKERS